MSREPITRYRPERTRSGGGYAEGLDAGAAETIWGRVEVHREEVIVTDVDVREDVRVGDVLVIEE